MKNAIKLLMCSVMAFCFASCTETPNEPAAEKFNFTLSVMENSIVATWDAIDGTAYYQLQLNDEPVVKTDKRAYKFENLKYDATYDVTLEAISAAGAVIESHTKSATIGKRNIPAYREWIHMAAATAISDNGQWVVGAFDHQGMVINLATDDITTADNMELYDVDNNGVGVGSYHGSVTDGVAAMFVNGKVVEIDLSSLTSNNLMSCLSGITPDGSYAVGWYWNYDSEDAYYAQIYGQIIPFCYDVVKNKVTVPTTGSRIYNEGAMSTTAVAPDRSILGLEQSLVMLNVVWSDEYTPYEYIYFEHDAEYNPVAGMGELQNRFSASGRYIYGKAQTYTKDTQNDQPGVYDRETGELYLYTGIGSVSGMTDDGIIFINDAPFGWGTTTYVTTLTEGDASQFKVMEEWLLSEYGIDVTKYEPATNTDPEDPYTLDGTITIGASADGRTLLCITNSMAGWVTSVVYLDGATL